MKVIKIFYRQQIIDAHVLSLDPINPLVRIQVSCLSLFLLRSIVFAFSPIIDVFSRLRMREKWAFEAIKVGSMNVQGKVRQDSIKLLTEKFCKGTPCVRKHNHILWKLKPPHIFSSSVCPFSFPLSSSHLSSLISRHFTWGTSKFIVL
jgi:hypothetical protein